MWFLDQHGPYTPFFLWLHDPICVTLLLYNDSMCELNMNFTKGHFLHFLNQNFNTVVSVLSKKVKYIHLIA